MVKLAVIPRESKNRVFISYNTADRQQVIRLLRDIGLDYGHVFVDWLHLERGTAPVSELETAITESTTILVCVGAHGIGPWQRREIYLALSLQADRPDLRVVPVYLSGAEVNKSFLTTNTYVDLRLEGNARDELESLRSLLLSGARPSFRRKIPLACPYRSLQAYTEVDGALLFGRETELDELIGLIGKHSYAALIGPSGVGKSSLIRGGLTPRLEGCLGISRPWHVITCRPGNQPFLRLARTLMSRVENASENIRSLTEALRLSQQLEAACGDVGTIKELFSMATGVDEFEDLQLLLAIDQLEDVEQLTNEMRQRFVQLLRSLGAGGVRIVLGIRSGSLDILDGIERSLESSVGIQRLSPMAREQLRRAIEGPARLGGKAFEEGLVDQLIEEALISEGALALLGFALERLWREADHRRETIISNASYARLGGLRKIIGEHAESVFQDIHEDEDVKQRALLRLVNIPERRRRGATRARVLEQELPPKEREVLEKFTEARLVVEDTDESEGRSLEFAHDEVLRSWSRLQRWIEDSTWLLGVRSEIRRLVGHEGRISLRGDLLAEGVRLLMQHSSWLTDAEQKLVRHSVLRRRLEHGVVIASVAILLVLCFAVTGLTLRNNAELRRDTLIIAIQEHLDASNQLWPATARMIPRYAQWRMKAEELLREGTKEREGKGRRDPREVRRRELLAHLGGTEKDVASRVLIAKSVASEIDASNSAALWQQVKEDSATWGKPVQEQDGLVPLGKDPLSGLWRFWLVPSGERPKISTRGVFKMNQSTGIVLVLLPPGRFLMGSNAGDDIAEKNEVGPGGQQIAVNIRTPIFVSAYEMTQGQYSAIMGVNPAYFTKESGDPKYRNFEANHPVEQVTWEEAREACRRHGLRLPTEIEWEYISRANTNTRWWCGDDPSCVSRSGNIADLSHARSCRPPDPNSGCAQPDWDDGFENTAPVGSFLPNRFGIYDTIGNVWEWTSTVYSTYGEQESGGRYRVIRGGSWGSGAAFSRSATRNRYQPTFRFYSFGLRPVRDVE